MEPLEELILGGWAFVNRIQTLSKLMETDLPTLGSPHPTPVGAERLLGGGRLWDVCSCLSTRDLLQVHFWLWLWGCPMSDCVGLGVIGHVGAGMSCNLSHDCWCQGGTTPVGLVSVSRKCPGWRSDHITDPYKYSAPWEGGRGPSLITEIAVYLKCTSWFNICTHCAHDLICTHCEGVHSWLNWCIHRLTY